MAPTYDAIVIGTGGVGSAAAMHLAQRGARVLGLDRFPGGHDRGSSHGQTRIIRQAYFEHSDYVPLLRRAYELWAELERDCDERLFRQVGLLQVGPADGVVVPGVLHAAREHQLDVDSLDATTTMRQFPAFAVDENLVGVFERKAGYLFVERCVLAHLRRAAQFGAELRTGEAVVTWRTVGDGVEVETTSGRYSAGRLIVTAGAWAGQLLAGLGVRLEVRRKHLYWFEPTDDRSHQDHGCPTFLFELPDGVYYGFPQIDGQGTKVAEHSGGSVVTNPLDDDRQIEPHDLARVRSFLSRCMPGVSAQTNQHAVCFYTMSPDENFIVDRHPEHPQVSFAAGLSGHGFKFTCVLGEALADLALHGATKLPIGFLNVGRSALR